MQEDIQERMAKLKELMEFKFETASEKTGELEALIKDISEQKMGFMIKDWHCFRLEASGYWVSLGDQCVVDISLTTDTIHPTTNVQGGRVTKNLEKLELYVADPKLFLRQGQLKLEYELEITLRLGKALLIDSKTEEKRIIRNLEETIIYKLPLLQKCLLSEQHK